MRVSIGAFYALIALGLVLPGNTALFFGVAGGLVACGAAVWIIGSTLRHALFGRASWEAAQERARIVYLSGLIDSAGAGVSPERLRSLARAGGLDVTADEAVALLSSRFREEGAA